MNKCYPSIRSILLPIHPLDKNERSEFETGEGSVSAGRDPSSGALRSASALQSAVQRMDG